MNKEEILAASRKENKKKDPVELEAEVKGTTIGVVVSLLLAAVFYITEIVIGRGQNYGMFACVIAPAAAAMIYKAIKLPEKKSILLAVIYTIWAVVLIGGYLWFVLK